MAALRVISGAKKGREAVDMGTGYERLEERRQRERLVQFYKMTNGLAPLTLTELIPEKRGKRKKYSFKTAEDISNPNTTSSYKATAI